MSKPDLIELAMRAVQETRAARADSNPSDAAHAEEAIQPPPIPTAPESADLTRTTPARETKTAEALAAMILADLGQIEGCPGRGVRVTVYGSNPWNSWLSFGGDAGPIPNKADLQGFCDIITERLKRLYDVST